MLKKYDEIIVLKNGKVIEKGKFVDLLEKKGYFYSFYNIETCDEAQHKIEAEI